MHDEPIDDIEAILIEILGAADEGADLEQLIARHPGQADAIRRRLEILGRLGLSGSPEGRRPRLAGFRLEDFLGRGGMAEVWAAVREKDGLRVALKVLRTSGLSASLLQRFRREAEALGRLDHPGIVGIHEHGQIGEQAYIAMELVDGRPLDEVLREREGLDLRRAVGWARDVARALAVAHAAGIVHRDLKPANILVTDEGRIVVIDFGLTRGLDQTTLSLTGAFIGSPHYAAPEQIRGDHDAVGPTTDVYAIGVTLYEILAGRPPFEGSRAEELFHRILTQDAPPIRKVEPRVSSDLARVVEKAMEKRPEDRYPDAAALADDLDAVLDLREVSARPPGALRRARRFVARRPVVAGMLGVLLLAVMTATTLQLLAERRDRIDREAQARAELAGAVRLLDEYLRETDDLPRRIQEFEWRKAEIHREVNAPEEVAAFDREQRRLELAQTSSERIFTQVMEILRRVEDLDPELEGPERLRARLYLDRWRVARARRDQVMVDFLAARVREHDPDGDLAAAVRPRRKINLTTDPPGARVDAFVFRRHDDLVEDGQPRLVPIPFRGSAGPEPGRLALRVRWSAAPLEPEDLVLALDGAEVREGAAELDRLTRRSESGPERPLDLLVWRDGETLELEAPADLLVRATAAPLFHGAASFVGRTPLVDHEVEGDELLLLVRAEGHEPERITVVGPERPIDLELIPREEIPRPFVRAWSYYGESMIVMDRELNCGEYLEFLSARTALDPLLVPQLPGPWPIDDDGRVALPEGIGPEVPVHGVSFAAAEAYAAWRSERARAAGRSWTFRLPEWRSWQVVVKSDGRSRRFPWGDHFRPHYAKSCFATERPCLEPGLRYPIDETTTGLYDTAGGVSELCRGWFWEERAQRPVHGGSWQHAEPARFELTYAWGLESREALGHVGFRLELVIAEK